MQGTVPTIHCDAEDGFCGNWEVNHYETGASFVDGIRVTREQRAPGWFTDDARDLDLCPEHNPKREN